MTALTEAREIIRSLVNVINVLVDPKELDEHLLGDQSVPNARKWLDSTHRENLAHHVLLASARFVHNRLHEIEKTNCPEGCVPRGAIMQSEKELLEKK